MQNPSNLFKILSIVFLSACEGPDPIEVSQCTPVMAFERSEDGRLYVNEEESSCYCRNYKFSKEYLGATGGSDEWPLEECNKLVGYSPDNYTTVTNYLEEVRRRINEVD